MYQTEIFISYAEEDWKLAEELMSRLRILEKQFPSVYIWSKRNILPGQDARRAIHQHLVEAKIILLFVSADLLASESDELALIEAKQRGETSLIIPIILRPCAWNETFLANIKPLPANKKPLSTWKSPTLAYREIINGIEEAVENSMQIGKTVKMTPPKSVDQTPKYIEGQG